MPNGLLGTMYYEGKGVTRNVDEAIHWLLEAAQQGNEMAKRNLGVMPEFVNSLQFKE
jgi:TPR repeat protein